MAEAPQVLFVELAGPDAESALRAFERTVVRHGIGCELLRSLERDDLWLLVVRGDLDHAQLPSGARTWRFTAPRAPAVRGS